MRSWPAYLAASLEISPSSTSSCWPASPPALKLPQLLGELFELENRRFSVEEHGLCWEAAQPTSSPIFLTSHYFDIFKSLLLWKRWTSLIFASQDTILENFGHCFWWRIWVSITALSVFWKIYRYRHPILLSSWNDNSNSLWSQWELVSVKTIHLRFFLFFPTATLSPKDGPRKSLSWDNTIKSNETNVLRSMFDN